MSWPRGNGARGVLRRAATPLRWGLAVVVLALVIDQTGSAPFRHGLHAVTLPIIALGIVIEAITTLCVAARWCRIARALGGTIGLGAAVGAYYRSQFLNVVLPTGILGDVHRAVAHGGPLGGVGRSARTVAWDRIWGQITQIVMTCALLLVLPSPVRGAMPVVVAALLASALVVGAVLWWLARRGSKVGPVPVRVVADDVRRLVGAGLWPRATGESALAVTGHVAVFLIAAWAIGLQVGLATSTGLALLVLAAMSVPLSVAGWGPREGVAFWAFAAAGLGGAAGVAVTTTYAVLVLCSVLPGGVLLLADAVRSHRGSPTGEAADVPTMAASPRAQMEADRG